MSQFQFPCPACQQAILCEDEYRGQALVCPHCNNQIIAPAAGSSPGGKPGGKLGVAASEPSAGPIPSTTIPFKSKFDKKKGMGTKWVAPVVVVVLLAGAGAVLYLNPQYIQWAKDKTGLAKAPPPPAPTNTVAEAPPPPPPPPPPATWQPELSTASFPDYNAKGSLNGADFSVDSARIDRTTLSLRQGTNAAPDLAFNLYLRIPPGETLDHKRWEVAMDDKTGVPQISKLWRPDPRFGPQQKLFNNGYALKLEFGQIENQKISGKIFLSLPDDQKSFVAGTFTADIKQVVDTPAQPQDQPAQRPNNMSDEMRRRYRLQ